MYWVIVEKMDSLKTQKQDSTLCNTDCTKLKAVDYVKAGWRHIVW